MFAIVRRHHPRRVRQSVGALCVALLLCLAMTACGVSSARQSSARGSAANAPGRTLVVLGASDAYGIGSYDPDRQSWPMQLAGDLPQPVHLVNLAIPGATLAQGQQEELPVAVAQHPQIVVLWLVVNDIIENVPLATYTAELQSTLATLHAASPKTHVFVGNVPDLARLPYFQLRDPVTLRAQVSAWNSAIAQVCAAEGATLADIASGWGQLGDHQDYISSDGLHPSSLGAVELAAFFDIVIRQSIDITR